MNALNKFKEWYPGKVEELSRGNYILDNNSVILLLKWNESHLIDKTWLEIAMVAAKRSGERLGVKTISKVCSFADKYRLGVTAEAKLIKLREDIDFFTREGYESLPPNETIGTAINDSAANQKWARYLSKRFKFLIRPGLFLIREPKR